MVKFLGEKETLSKAEKLCVDNNFEFLDKTSKSFIVQALGLRTEIDEFIKKIKVLGEVSISRTGALAMNKGAETVKDNKGKVSDKYNVTPKQEEERIRGTRRYRKVRKEEPKEE